MAKQPKQPAEPSEKLAALKAELDEATPDRFSSREALTRHKKALGEYEAALREQDQA